METTIRKIGNSVGAIIPSELNAEAGDKYKIVRIGDTFVMTPLRDNLFSNENGWVGFRDSISKEDREWDEADD
ncbi:Programmed cell death antitoxin MazE [Levilactobacillus koreensis]|uniref:Programmed cell death antitoxin MazE n=1 Tax=Levilactobacillus koreensis TaxID=637971 RepID=A0AAC8ZH62_9LACO|nr:Programmed cell death antitoxin MazE [Levilactobacillus koreensis]AKP65760.1 Programmed cell death antitoxin MazE [Levilactobacillus koreensis]